MKFVEINQMKRRLIVVVLINVCFLAVLFWQFLSQRAKDPFPPSNEQPLTVESVLDGKDTAPASHADGSNEVITNYHTNRSHEVDDMLEEEDNVRQVATTNEVPLLLHPDETHFQYGELINSVPEQGKKVAFTFDAAWEFKNTEPLLDLLGSFEIPATFFISGMWADKHPDLMDKIHAAGHEIVNHGYSHKDLNTMSREQIVEEVTRTAEVLSRHIPYHSNLFRLPYGEGSPEVLSILRDLGYFVVGWSADSADWMEDLSPEAIINRVKKNTKDGGIVLFHVGGYETLNVLPDLIEWYWSQGYEFVTVSDLLRTRRKQ